MPDLPAADTVPEEEFSAEAIRAQLERVCASPAFAQAERIQSFLRYVVEEVVQGNADRLKGYTIGLEVFGRDEGFDAQADPIVRVEAGRLRRRLIQYYAEDGHDDPIRIDIPKGRYVPEFRPNGRAPAAPAPAPGTAAAPDAPVAAETPSRQEPAADAPDDVLLILVVDDEPSMEHLMLRRFRKAIRDGSLSFLFARDGEEARDMLHRHPDIAMVLTDINMPRMDGLTLVRAMREEMPGHPAVVISAYGDMPNIRKAMNLGAFDFLTKPIDFDDLLATIGKTAEHIRALRDAKRSESQLLALRQELRLARRIQAATQPTAFPEAAGLDVHAHTLPAREVTGDFYDVFPLAKARWGLMLGGVSGRGVPAAIFASIARTMVKALLAGGQSPGPCLERVNDLLCQSNTSGMFATLLLADYEPDSGRLRFALAGQNVPYALAPGAAPAPLCESTSEPIGLTPGLGFEERAHEIPLGGGVFCHSDGVARALDAASRQFSDARVEETLAGAGELDAAGLTTRVLGAVAEFAGDVAQQDDMTCLALRRG